MTDETNLVLGSLIIPVGAGRGVTQTLAPIDNGDLRRTVNGTLLDMTRTQNRKFTSTIRVSDQSSPTLAGLWKGSDLTVSCVAKLRQLVSPANDVVVLMRTPVEASIIGRDINGDKVALADLTDDTATFADDVVMVEFAPILDMKITNISNDADEYAAQESWELSLEEV